MRSIQRALVLTAGLLVAGGPGVSVAAWDAQDNGPRFGGRDQDALSFAPQRVSLAPKESVADLRDFQQLESHDAALYGPTGPGKPALDRYIAGHQRKESTSIAVDTD